jgi:hypothetical protein
MVVAVNTAVNVVNAIVLLHVVSSVALPEVWEESEQGLKGSIFMKGCREWQTIYFSFVWGIYLTAGWVLNYHFASCLPWWIPVIWSLLHSLTVHCGWTAQQFSTKPPLTNNYQKWASVVGNGSRMVLERCVWSIGCLFDTGLLILQEGDSPKVNTLLCIEYTCLLGSRRVL